MKRAGRMIAVLALVAGCAPPWRGQPRGRADGRCGGRASHDDRGPLRWRSSRQAWRSTCGRGSRTIWTWPPNTYGSTRWRRHGGRSRRQSRRAGGAVCHHERPRESSLISLTPSFIPACGSPSGSETTPAFSTPCGASSSRELLGLVALLIALAIVTGHLLWFFERRTIPSPSRRATSAACGRRSGGACRRRDHRRL